VDPSSPFGSLPPPFDGSLPPRIGGYRVLRRLATGGTSDVLLARAEGPHGLGRVVVLKLLLQQYRDDKSFERMFAREAAAYARLSHPAIVKLFDFFSDAGQLVMVLEHVDGLPLHKLRALLRPPPGERLAFDDRAAMFVAWRIFGALSAAHSAKDPQTGEFSPVVHRDVNPSNVLIPWDGQVKIADFGIAKLAGVDNDNTQAGFIKGTYGYMAPEQVRGEGITVRADVYAGCLLLWELLAGRKAIVRGRMSDLEVLRAMAEPSFPTLAALRPDLPPRVLEAVGRGLQPDPERRAIQAEELVGTLRASFSLEEGRQRLVAALAGVRPPPVTDEVETPSRPPATGAGDASAGATVPNPAVLRLARSSAHPERAREASSRADRPRPTSPPAASPPAVSPPTPAAPTAPLAPPPPRASPAIAESGASTQRMATAPAPPPARSAGSPAARRPSSSPSEAGPAPRLPPTPTPTMSIAPSLPAAAKPRSVPPPPPPTVSTSAGPPPVSSLAAARGSVSPMPPYALAPSVSPPSPFPLAPSVPPPPMLDSPPETPIAPTFFAPPPSPAAVAWTPPMSHELPAQGPGRVGVVVLASVLALAGCAGLAVVVWARTRSTAYSPPVVDRPAPRPSAAPTPVLPTTPAPVASAASSAEPSAPALASSSGTLTIPAAHGGHRVWIDKHIVGESPGSFPVSCGWHGVQVGSQGAVQNVRVPCGGDVEVP
jgi:serine/threonine protein kinase